MEEEIKFNESQQSMMSYQSPDKNLTLRSHENAISETIILLRQGNYEDCSNLLVNYYKGNEEKFKQALPLMERVTDMIPFGLILKQKQGNIHGKIVVSEIFPAHVGNLVLYCDVEKFAIAVEYYNGTRPELVYLSVKDS